MKKIALIGTQGYERRGEDLRIDCFPWHKINEITNLQDYDMLLFNLLSLTTPAVLNGPEFHGKFNFDIAFEILRPGGQIIVLGDPRFKIRTSPSPIPAIEEPFLAWTGIVFTWDNRPGDTVSFDEKQGPAFRELMRYLRRWDYSLRRCDLDPKVFEKRFDRKELEKVGLQLQIVRNFFCVNRYDAALAFSVWWRLERVTHGTYGPPSETIVHEYGRIIFLPRMDLGEDEAITLVLKDVCGVETELPEPTWVAQLRAPGQEVVDEEIAGIAAQLEALRAQLRAAESKRSNVRATLKLLYDRGSSLELVVRDTLRKLGAQVEDPKEPGKEDGWITYQLDGQTLEGVLEVKSTRNQQFPENALRQLLDWIQRGVELRKKKYKGIFVGSNALDKALSERPAAFSDSWKKSAELYQIVAIKAEHLYAAYSLNAMGKLDVEVFWKQVFITDGIFDGSGYWKMLTSVK